MAIQVILYNGSTVLHQIDIVPVYTNSVSPGNFTARYLYQYPMRRSTCLAYIHSRLKT